MCGNNWRSNPNQPLVPGQMVGEAPYGSRMDAGDWRTQISADSRRRIVNKILETLKRHLPFSGQEGGLRELEKIGVRLEEKAYTAATSQSDYLRAISLKMLEIETKSRNPMVNSFQSSAPSNMDGNNWRAIPNQPQVPGQMMGGEAPAGPGMGAGVWRTQIPTDSRRRIVNKILETLKRHLPCSGQEGELRELDKIAVWFEEKAYTAATSQSDYLREISLKMLVIETNSRNPMVNSLQSRLSSAPSNMGGNNWRSIPNQLQVPGQMMSGEAPAGPGMGAGDWRTQILADSRRRIVNKIMESLKRHLPLSGEEGLQQLKEIATIFEEKTYNGATSQSDYLRKISLKMLLMETKSQSNNKNLQMPNQGQSLPMPMVNNQSQLQHQANPMQREMHQRVATSRQHSTFDQQRFH